MLKRFADELLQLGRIGMDGSSETLLFDMLAGVQHYAEVVLYRRRKQRRKLRPCGPLVLAGTFPS